MVTERSSSFVIGVSGDDSDIESFLAGLRTKFKSATADIEATTRKVVLFEGLEQKVKASGEALLSASANAKILAAELDKVQAAGGKATPELIAGLKSANAEVSKATTEYNRNVDALSKLQTTLSRAGVDTSNLARAQLALAESSRVATAAAADQAAKQVLGLKTLQDIAPQLTKLNAAYATLRDSGTLSVKELGAAQVALQAKLKETNASITAVSGGFRDAATSAITFARTSYAQIVGIGLALGAAAAAFGKVTDASHEYRQGLAEVGTVTNLTKTQLDELGVGARQLAASIGFELTFEQRMKLGSQG